jgi:hypothetical protein
VTRKIPVMLVRTAAFSREIAVPATAVQRDCAVCYEGRYPPEHHGTWNDYSKAPAVVSHKQPWLTARARAEMRAEAAAMPRDPKGRFLKKV